MGDLTNNPLSKIKGWRRQQCESIWWCIFSVLCGWSLVPISSIFILMMFTHFWITFSPFLSSCYQKGSIPLRNSMKNMLYMIEKLPNTGLASKLRLLWQLSLTCMSVEINEQREAALLADPDRILPFLFYNVGLCESPAKPNKRYKTFEMTWALLHTHICTTLHDAAKLLFFKPPLCHMSTAAFHPELLLCRPRWQTLPINPSRMSPVKHKAPVTGCRGPWLGRVIAVHLFIQLRWHSLGSACYHRPKTNPGKQGISSGSCLSLLIWV